MSSTDNMTNWLRDRTDEIMRGRCFGIWGGFRNVKCEQVDVGVR